MATGQPTKATGEPHDKIGNASWHIGNALRMPDKPSDLSFDTSDQPKPMQNAGNRPSARPATPPEGKAGTAAKPPSGTGAPNPPPASPALLPASPATRSSANPDRFTFQKAKVTE